MDSRDYKKKSNQSNAFSREVLERTITVVQSDPDLKDLLNNLLQSIPIEKPIEHSGFAKDDIFQIALPRQIIEKIVFRLLEKEAELAESNAFNHQKLSEAADLVNKWNRLLATMN
jgi:hypothetical protein